VLQKQVLSLRAEREKILRVPLRFPRVGSLISRS
jgi:hypothetical protein